MHRIVILAAALALAVSFSSAALAQKAKKGNPLCAMEACLANCSKVGGQPRLCPEYCVKRINERKAAGQC